MPLLREIKSTLTGWYLIERLDNSNRKIYLDLLSSMRYSFEYGYYLGAYGYKIKGDNYVIKIYPNYHPIICTDIGKWWATSTRILAHELGHATGTEDDGIGGMNNINTWENPIMYELEYVKRIRLKPCE